MPGPGLHLLTAFVLSTEQPPFWDAPRGTFAEPVLDESARLQLIASFVLSTRSRAILGGEPFVMELQTQHPTVRPHKFRLWQLRALEDFLMSLSSTSATPNHALQRTAPCVTAPASATTLPPTMQVPRRTPRSLSLGSLGD